MGRMGMVVVVLIMILGTSQPACAEEVQTYPRAGLLLSVGGFDYFTAGIGCARGEYRVAGGHFAASVYGIGIEYKTIQEVHARPFARLYGGSGGALLGISAPVAWDCHSFAVGIAPEIGVGFASMNILYRYNIYLNRAFNCHEIVINHIPVHFGSE